MVKNYLIKIAFFMLIISSLNLISSAVLTGNLSNSIETSYAPGQAVSGWVNISLSSVSANSKLKSNLGGEISLISLLKTPENSNFSYTCFPSSCNNSYSAKDEDTYKNLSFKIYESNLIGFKIVSTALITSISSFSLKLQANHGESSDLPILIDVLDDENVEWQSYIPSSNYDSKNYGCFKDQDTNLLLVDVNTYCQRMLLPSTSPGVKIGANVIGNGAAKFDLSIGDEIVTKNCEATATGSGEISCLPGILYITPGNYTVCIKAKDANAKTYSIKAENKNPCGYAGNQESAYDFQLFSQQRRYSALGICPTAQPNLCVDDRGNTFCIAETCPISSEILINKSEPCPTTHSNICNPTIEPQKTFCMNTSCSVYNQILDSTPTTLTLNNTEFKKAIGETKNIEYEIYDYIAYEYQGNCSKGCIIPMRVYSGIDQSLNFSNFNLAYSAGGITQATNKFYNLDQDVSKISSGYNKLYLDPAKLFLPSTYGNKTLSISVDGTNIFSKNILIQNVATISYITPTTTAKGYPTTFKPKLSSNATIIKYTWDFGDGIIYETSEDKATHTYTELGKYNVQIKIQDNASKTATSVFPIEVVSSINIVPELVERSLINLNNIKTSLINFSSFEKFSINYSLDLGIKENTLKLINSSLALMNESSYDLALGELIDSEIPSKIVKIPETESDLYLNEDNIDVGVITSYLQTQINASEQAYKEQILAWDLENLDLKVKELEFLGYYDSGYQNPVSKIFKFEIDKKTDYGQEIYLFVPQLEKLLFNGEYGQITQDNYWVIPLNSNTNEIIFSTSEDIEVLDIPAFISPKISELTVIEVVDDSEEIELKEKNKKILFMITSCIVVAIGGVAWFLIQRWYKKKYETHLFRDRNNLYNIINYIHDSKKLGVEEKEIVKSLKGNGWTGEQITYALKKYKGKRVKTN